MAWAYLKIYTVQMSFQLEPVMYINKQVGQLISSQRDVHFETV